MRDDTSCITIDFWTAYNKDPLNRDLLHKHPQVKEPFCSSFIFQAPIVSFTFENKCYYSLLEVHLSHFDSLLRSLKVVSIQSFSLLLVILDG